MDNKLAYELQLGNSILRKNSNDNWIETKVNLTYLCLIYDFPEDYKGIELTEQLFIMNGYEADKWRDGDKEIGIWYSEDFKLDGRDEMKPLKYLHQLENLEKIINS